MLSKKLTISEMQENLANLNVIINSTLVNLKFFANAQQLEDQEHTLLNSLEHLCDAFETQAKLLKNICLSNGWSK